MGIYSIVGFFQKGGMFMYPILIVFTVGVAIAVERWMQLNRTRNENRKIWDQIQPVLSKGEFDKARSMVNDDKSTISQMLSM
ncbi:MAG: MotA/TolQ/ExbB proton channel family protein, partial [Desulfuromonadales bacterium]|nr:MotA/TolQ/ExbB proton channel family protein [Desulfuromonadales bacterium]